MSTTEKLFLKSVIHLYNSVLWNHQRWIWIDRLEIYDCAYKFYIYIKWLHYKNETSYQSEVYKQWSKMISFFYFLLFWLFINLPWWTYAAIIIKHINFSIFKFEVDRQLESHILTQVHVLTDFAFQGFRLSFKLSYKAGPPICRNCSRLVLKINKNCLK